MKLKLTLLALALIVLLAAFVPVLGTTNFDSVTLSGNLRVGGTANVTGKTTLTGGLVLAQQSETVTATFVITPTSPYIVMTSGAAYTSSTTTPIITTTATAGQVLILRNGNASDALVIDGTGGTVECKANVSLGASDTLTLIFNGSVWNCVAGYDNS